MPADSRCHPAYLGPSMSQRPLDPPPMESTGERHWRGTGAHKRRRLIWRQFEELASRKIAAILEGEAKDCRRMLLTRTRMYMNMNLNLSIYQSINYQSINQSIYIHPPTLPIQLSPIHLPSVGSNSTQERISQTNMEK